MSLSTLDYPRHDSQRLPGAETEPFRLAMQGGVMAVAQFALVVACLLVARSTMASDLPKVTVSTVPLSNPEIKRSCKVQCSTRSKASQTCIVVCPTLMRAPLVVGSPQPRTLYNTMAVSSP